MFQKIVGRSTFSNNVFTLFTGKVIVAGVALLASFIITRLYSSEQIGAYSWFVSALGILTIISTGRYDTAIVIEEETKKVKGLWVLSLLLSFTFSLFLFVVLFYFASLLSGMLNITSLSDWTLILPVCIFLGAIVRSTQFYFNKEATYSPIRNSEVLKSSSNSIFSVIFGVLQVLRLGLVYSQLLANLFSAGYLLYQLPSNFLKHLGAIVNKKELVAIAIKYKDYFTLYTFSGLLNALVVNGTPLFIVFFFSEGVAGYYFMAEKIVSLPIALVVMSISSVYFQRGSVLYKEDKVQFLRFTNSIQKKVAFFLIPYLIVLSILGPYFFGLFGEGWSASGEMVKYFAIFMLFSHLMSPVGSISNIIDRLDLFLYFNMAIALFRFLTFYVGSIYLDFENALLFSSILVAACYFLFDLLLKKIIKEEISLL